MLRLAQNPLLPTDPHITIHNHQAPDCLDNVMQICNYAVTVFGVSFFELLHYGIPTVVFSPYNGKDNPELDAIAEAGVAIVAEDEVDAVGKLVDLMNNESYSRKISKNALELLNPPGTIRLCSEVSGLFGS